MDLEFFDHILSHATVYLCGKMMSNLQLITLPLHAMQLI